MDAHVWYVTGKPDEKPFLAVYVKWSVNRDKCAGKFVRWVCVFGIGDLKDLIGRHEFFVNKFDAHYDALALQCAETWLEHRVQCSTQIDANFYASLPHVMQQSL